MTEPPLLNFEPSNEQEVVLLFGRLLSQMPRPVTIDFVQTGFPDCRAIDGEGRPVWIEFELFASHYWRDHRNHPHVPDWIVCWHDDGHPNVERPIVVPLDRKLDEVRNPENLVKHRRAPDVTNEEYFQLRYHAWPAHHTQLVLGLFALKDDLDIRVEWPDTSATCFTLRDSLEYVKLDANGLISTPFSRWTAIPQHEKARIATELNRALGKQWFSPSGKKSVSIELVLPDERATLVYLGVLRKVITSRRANPHL